LPLTFASEPLSAEACSRSSALPLAKLSLLGMSKSTTSPSCLATQRFASSPPMLPAPISAIFFLAMSVRLQKFFPARLACADGGWCAPTALAGVAQCDVESNRALVSFFAVVGQVWGSHETVFRWSGERAPN